MNINLIPTRHNTRLTLTRSGDVLTINGADYDFAPLPEGATLPPEAVDSEFITGPVERIGGVLHFHGVLLPFGANTPHETRSADAITLTEDGPVSLPPYDMETDNAAD
ncbi:hypothetical protein [uncultured Roseovarius sp.]|uniref:hypothetical protein n=1 Tax=uncultured Roseovarius sp. TaxID=293344 RepID=UPI002639E200|nr:hypothetical protein [uncultured Roseovarius sp.]